MIYIASDHTGFDLKNKIKIELDEQCRDYEDVSQNFIEEDDYPDMVKNACSRIKEQDLAILICGTGIGSAIAANKIKGIRAAVCYDEYTAKMTRTDNDANVLCLGSRTTFSDDISEIINIINTFISTKFSKEERHIRRINKIKEMENNK